MSKAVSRRRRPPRAWSSISRAHSSKAGTLGAEGCEAWEQGARTSIAPVPAAEVVDPNHEETMVKGAIRTDFILSAEIMALFAGLPERGDSSDFGRTELGEAASRLALPVHLIRGGSSDLVSPEAVAHFRNLVPHAAYSDIADATHMVVGDQNDVFGAAIADFLMQTHAASDAR